MKLLEFLNKLDATDLISETSEAMESNHALIVELNTVQLDQGELANETYLPPYSELTKMQKRAKGQQTDPMNLRDTNEFRSGFFLKLSGPKYNLDSSSPKTETLVDRYSSAIFGLNAEYRIKAWREFLRITVVKQLNIKWKS